jgi:diaminopropionate ammonia-lyase
MFPSAPPTRFFLNPRAAPSLAYGPERSKILNFRTHQAAVEEISSWDGYAPTPLRILPGLAGKLGLQTLWYKDEGTRFGLGSFKALGGIYGVFRVLRAFLEQVTGDPRISSKDLSEGRFPQLLSGVTVSCASAGNHGRAVARGAQMFGCRSVVFLPCDTPTHRVEAIRALGSRTVPVDGTYDDAVALAAREAREKGWWPVSDTTYPGYEEVPRYIMQGYTVLVQEALDQLPKGTLPTHVFLQGGVGGLAAAVTGHLWEHLGCDRPRIVVVEPSEADCLLESALRGKPYPSSGRLDTSMECLACGNVSTLAWGILEEGADAFLSIQDSAAEEAVDVLGRGWSGDPPVLTQPSGAAGLAGLISATVEPGLAGPLGLGKESRVLIIGSEGPAWTKDLP